MKNTFKKSLLAIAVAGVSTFAIAEADLNTTLKAVSVDGQLGATQTSNTVTVALDAEYAAGDIIKLNFSGAALDVNSVTAPNSAAVNLGILESSETGVTYRVVGTSGTTTGGVVNFGTFAFNSEDLAASGSVSAKYSAETSTGVSLDGGKLNSEALFVAGPQLVATVQQSGRLDGVANISYDRLLFTNGTATDTLTFTIGGYNGVFNDDNTLIASFDPAQAATITEATYSVSGDFSWVVDTNENVEGIQADADTFTPDCGTAGTLKADSFTVEGDQVSFACEGLGLQFGFISPSLAMDLRQGESATFALNPIPSTSFTASIDYKVSGGSVAEDSVSANGGAWTLNAAERHVSYMPFGPNIGQIIYVTNDSAKDGEVTINVYDENGETLAENYSAGTATAGGVTQIAGAVQEAVGDYQGKARIEITVDAPSHNVTVYSAYNVGGSDRGFVSNN